MCASVSTLCSVYFNFNSLIFQTFIFSGERSLKSPIQFFTKVYFYCVFCVLIENCRYQIIDYQKCFTDFLKNMLPLFISLINLLQKAASSFNQVLLTYVFLSQCTLVIAYKTFIKHPDLAKVT